MARRFGNKLRINGSVQADRVFVWPRAPRPNSRYSACSLGTSRVAHAPPTKPRFFELPADANAVLKLAAPRLPGIVRATLDEHLVLIGAPCAAAADWVTP